MKPVRLFLALILVALALLACSTPAAPAATSAAPQGGEATAAPQQGTPVVGGTLNIISAAMTQFDPAFCADDPSFHAVSQIFSFLVRRQGNEVIPDLATSWNYEDDTTLVFNLRHGVMFHDDNAVFPKGQSREVVADDVVYSINRALTAEGNTQPADLRAAFDSAEAVDKYTVRIKFKTPDGLLFANARGLSIMGIVPKEAIDKLGKDFAMNPVGSGPFKFSEYKQDDHLTLVRNDLYWKKPNLDKVVFKVIPDANVQAMTLESGEGDVMLDGLPATEYDRLIADSDYAVVAGGCPLATQLLFQLKNPLYAEVKFRQAISYALDKEGINTSVRRNMAIPGYGTAGPGVPGYVEDLGSKYFGYDPAKAKALLQELGYTDSNNDGIVDKDGQPLKVPLEIWSMAPMPAYGSAIATQLKEVGIQVDLQTVEFGTWIEDFYASADKLFMTSGFCGDGGLSSLWGRGSLDAIGLDDQDLFDLLDESNQTVDAAQRDQLLQQATDRIYGQYYAVPMGFTDVFLANRTWVHDYTPGLWFLNLCTEKSNVWVDKKS